MRIRRMALLVMVCLAVVAALAAPSTAGAGWAYREIYRSKGKAAEAMTFVEEPDGGYSMAGIGGAEMMQWSRSPETTDETYDWVGVARVSTYDPDGYVVYREVLGMTPEAFTINRTLSKANVSFECVGEIAEWVGTPPWESPDGWRGPDSVSETPIAVNATWTGVGRLRAENSIERFFDGDVFVTFHDHWLSRDAVCVGSIIGDEGTLYFDGAFDEAFMADVASGSVTAFKTYPN